VTESTHHLNLCGQSFIDTHMWWSGWNDFPCRFQKLNWSQIWWDVFIANPSWTISLKKIPIFKTKCNHLTGHNSLPTWRYIELHTGIYEIHILKKWWTQINNKVELLVTAPSYGHKSNNSVFLKTFFFIIIYFFLKIISEKIRLPYLYTNDLNFHLCERSCVN